MAVAAVVTEVVPRAIVTGTEVSPLDAVAVIVPMVATDPVCYLVEVGCQIADWPRIPNRDSRRLLRYQVPWPERL